MIFITLMKNLSSKFVYFFSHRSVHNCWFYANDVYWTRVDRTVIGVLHCACTGRYRFRSERSEHNVEPAENCMQLVLLVVEKPEWIQIWKSTYDKAILTALSIIYWIVLTLHNVFHNPNMISIGDTMGNFLKTSYICVYGESLIQKLSFVVVILGYWLMAFFSVVVFIIV